MVADLIHYAYLNHIEVTFGEAWRSIETQKMYVENGRSKTLNSKHLDRLAVDLNVFINGEYRTDKASYEPLGAYWKTLDPLNKWGGDWGWDANHFETSKD